MEGAREVAWAVTRTGCARAQVTGDYAALVSEMAEAWLGLFPRRLGYLTETKRIDEHRVRLEVRRGDFEGVVELGCDHPPQDSSKAVRIVAFASARSQRLVTAEEAGQRVIRRARGVAVGIGVAMSAGFCWLAAGVQMPVLGGAMLSVITTCLLVGGGNLGSRVGEGVASRRKLDAERAVLDDLGVQADLRRWNSLNRQLRSHRRALTRGIAGGPFRRPALGA